MATMPARAVAMTRPRRRLGTILKNEVGTSVPLRLYNINAQAIRTIETKKCVMFAYGLSPVSTTTPPITICAKTPSTRLHDSQTRSDRRGERRCESRTAAITLKETTPVNNLLACSIAVCPEETSMNFVLLQLGQSTQPSPEPVRRTKAPEKTITHKDPRAVPHTML
jgi:hypothetical protein